MAKVNEEHILAIKTNKGEMDKIQAELGMIALMELRKSVLLNAYTEFEKKANEAIEAINVEHGDGSVDLETGEFTPKEQ
jgi:hypothetical protein